MFVCYTLFTASSMSDVTQEPSGENQCAKFTVITQGDCGDSDLLPIFNPQECALAALCSGLIASTDDVLGGSTDSIPTQNTNDRPFGCRYQNFGSPVWINERHFPNTGASETHRLLCKQDDVATYSSCVWKEAAAANPQVAGQMDGAAPGDALSDEKLSQLSSQLNTFSENGFIECDTSGPTNKFELVHGGLCAETEVAVPNTMQGSVTACRDHCARHVMDGYFAFSDRHCICYKADTGCPNGAGYVHYNSYRIIYDFGFTLFGDMGDERVIITDGSKVIGPVTLTTGATDFIANNREITIHFDDASNKIGDANVFFVSPEYKTVISSEELFDHWKCSEPGNPRCDAVRRGEFNWKAQYTIQFYKHVCEAVVYEDKDFHGWSVTFGPGEYTLGDLRGAGVVNDEISSVSIAGERCCVEFFTHQLFDGDKQKKCESDDYLRTYNDEISSMKVFLEDDGERACRIDTHCPDHFMCENRVCVQKPCEQRSDCDWIEEMACAADPSMCDMRLKCHRDSGVCVPTEIGFKDDDCVLSQQCYQDLHCSWGRCSNNPWYNPWGWGRRNLADNTVKSYDSWRRTL